MPPKFISPYPNYNCNIAKSQITKLRKIKMVQTQGKEQWSCPIIKWEVFS